MPRHYPARWSGRFVSVRPRHSQMPRCSPTRPVSQESATRFAPSWRVPIGWTSSWRSSSGTACASSRTDWRRRARAGVPLRLITTTYMGATERAALDRLVRDFGADVKVQYDAQRTRLHAKAWLFRRNTGFDTAYVGSSNLSRAAMLDGVEWNVRLSSVSTPPLLRKFLATFDSYWNDPTFESYDPDADRDKLDDALAEAAGKRISDRVTLTLSGLEVRPYPYQQEMLDQLEVERIVHGRHRNLLVAATGTGKTVVAALDYRRLAADAPTLPGLALHRAPPRDPPAVLAHLSRGACRRELRRALRGRSSPRALGACLRFGAITVGVRHHEHPPGGLPRRRHRRVPPRRGEDVPTDPRAPQPTRATWPDGHPRTWRRPRRAVVLRWTHRGRAAACGMPSEQTC